MSGIVLLSSLAASLTGCIFGYDIGGSGGTLVMSSFRKFAGWTELKEGVPEAAAVATIQGWLNGVFSIGCIIGCLMSASCVDYVGRRKTLLLMALVFIVGGTFQLATPNMEVLLAGRGIGGVSVGALSMASPLYISEIAPANIRGRLVTVQQLAITFGILFAACANVGLKNLSFGWRISYGGNTAFAVVLFILLLFLPESPRHLVAKGKEEEARKALLRLHGKDNPALVEAELRNNIQEAMQRLRRPQARWADFCSEPGALRRLMTGVGIQFLQQLTGINAVMFYAPVIFKSFLEAEEALVANLAVMSINFISTFITIALVDRVGRRPLLIGGATGMAASTFALAALAGSVDEEEKREAQFTYLFVAFLGSHIVFFASSWGPLGWLIPAEILPHQLRGKGTMLTSLANWLTNLAVAVATPLFLVYFDLWGTFFFFSMWCLLMAFFGFFFVPELKGVELGQVGQVFEEFEMKRVGARRKKKQTQVGQSTCNATSPKNGNRDSLIY